MTREDLLVMIYEDNTYRSCPTKKTQCELEDAEINTQEYCKKCAEMLLTEYENKIRADERARLLGILTPLGAMDSFEVDDKELKWGIRYAIETIRGGTLENVLKEQTSK